MRTLAILLCRVVGTLLIITAVALWIYSPSISTDAPFRLILIPGPEILYGFVRWIVIAVIGGFGAFLWTIGRTSRGSSP